MIIMMTRWNPTKRPISRADQPQHGGVRGAVRQVGNHGQWTVPGDDNDNDDDYYDDDDDNDNDDDDGGVCGHFQVMMTIMAISVMMINIMMCIVVQFQF